MIAILQAIATVVVIVIIIGVLTMVVEDSVPSSEDQGEGRYW